MATKYHRTRGVRLSLKQFQDVVHGLPEELEGAIVRGLRSSALRGQSIVVGQIQEAKPFPAVNTSQLLQSVKSGHLPDGAELHVDAPHAPMIERGTRPFYPPIGPLRVWAARKFGLGDAEALSVARAVAATIAKRGIKPRHFFRKAMREVRNKVVPVEIKRELDAL